MLDQIWQKVLKKNDTIKFENYLKGNYPESMFAEPITEYGQYEIITEIEKLNTNKSAGYDEISFKMVKK